MKSLFTCPECGTELEEYESQNQECCSNVCAQRRRFGLLTEKIVPVDFYFDHPGSLHEESYDPINAVDSVLSAEDYDALHGVVTEYLNPRQEVYSIMNKNRDSLIILKECTHKGPKDRHHPNYDRPLEVELLCKKCHNIKHESQHQEYSYDFLCSKKVKRPVTPNPQHQPRHSQRVQC